MNKIEPGEIFVADTGSERGRGVFAGRALASGELVETVPVLVLLMPFEKLPPRLRRIVFNWGSLTNSREPSSAVLFGYGSLYNHANPANLRYEADAAQEAVHFYAVREIAANEELTINYNAGGGTATSSSDDWFARQGIKPI